MSILHTLNIPQMGSVENAKILEWRISEGDSFKEGDILYEVETDKTATEVEAVEAGILARQIGRTDDEMKIGDKVGLWVPPGTSPTAIAEALAAIDEAGPATVAEQAIAPSTTTADPTDMKGIAGRISPLVRKLAKDHGVDLSAVTGTGPGGKVTQDDVLAAGGGDRPTLAPHSMRRKAIAQTLTKAAAVPSLTADMQIDLSALFARRAALKEAGQPTPSILGYIAHVTATTILKHPKLNATWGEQELSLWPTVNLGIAVDAEDGLIVPVIRNAEQQDPMALTQAIAALAESVRTGSVRQADLEGGTFTISNPGSVGPVMRAEALLNVPQVALLGVGGIVHSPRAAMVDGEWTVAVKPMVCFSLTFDHRAIDGGPVIAFLNALKAGIEAL